MLSAGYIIKVIAGSGLFLALYRWMIAGKISFRLCRLYLMVTMILAAAIPAMNVPIYTSGHRVSDQVLTGFMNFDETVLLPQADEPSRSTTAVQESGAVTQEQAIQNHPDTRKKHDMSAGTVFLAIYIFGVVVSLGLIVYNVFRIGRQRRRSRLTVTETYTLAEHEDIRTPFSFLKTIFMGFNYEQYERSLILTHEASHIRHGHSFERLALSVLRSVYWFNPFFRMAEKDLEEVQEWEADKDVLDEGHEIRSYRTTIFKQLFGYNPDISCGLNHSLTKQRFIMMTQSHRGKGAWIRLAATLPAIAAVFLAFGCVARSSKPAEHKADADLTDTAAIHLSMPCNPIRIMNGYGSRTVRSVFSPKHTGIDFALDEGDPIWAAADGDLVSIEYGDETIVTHDRTTDITTFHYPENIHIPAEASAEPGRFNIGDVEVNVTGITGIQEFRCGPESPGLTVRIMHEGGIETIYRNMPYVALRPDRIKAGQMIGKAGMTARSTGPHLHFEVHKDGKPVDPAPYLSTAGETSKAVFIDIKKTGEGKNRFSHIYGIEIDGEMQKAENVKECVAAKIAKDSSITVVQISAGPQTPMGIIEDIKDGLIGLEGIRLFFVLEGTAITPPDRAEHIRDEYGRISYNYKRNNIIVIKTNSDDRYLIGSLPDYLNDESMERLKGYILNKEDDPKLPDRTEEEFTLPDGTTITYPVSQATVLMQNDRGTSFKGYQDINRFVRNAWFELYDEISNEIFGRSYADLSDPEMDIIRRILPMRIMEEQPKNLPAKE